jgi:AraC-like DNA-binding protein
VGLSQSQLNRLFLRERGQTVRQCHQHQRLEYAHTLLMRHDLSLKEVAMELGFKHQSNFTAWFRKLHRMTPSEFRELDPKKTLFTRPKPE